MRKYILHPHHILYLSTHRLLQKLHKINASTILSLSDEDLQNIGISFKKVSYIKNLALKVHNGELKIDELHNKSDEEVIKILSSLNGVGVWTAQMILIFCLQRPIVRSFGDFAIQKGIKILYGHKELNKERFARYEKRYSPQGSVASLYLWEIAGGQS